MSNSTYGRLVISDITHYADKDDLEELLRRRFPATPTQPKPWRYNIDRQGAFRVWAPEKITPDEIKELYEKNDARRGEPVDLLSLRYYQTGI